MVKVFIGLILTLIFCIIFTELKQHHKSWYPVYKNKQTKKYYQILRYEYEQSSLIRIRRKRKFLLFYFDTWSEQDHLITDAELKSDYIRIG